MKILRLLNKIYFSIIFFLLLAINSFAEEKPVDIWNIDQDKIENDSLNSINAAEGNLENSNKSQSNIYKMQDNKKKNSIKFVEEINSPKVDIIGLYDPEKNSLDINMWNNSDGDQLKKIFSKLNKMKLSSDAAEIMKISLLTNSYIPKKNITKDEFLKFKSDWLINNSDLDLIEEYIIKNQIFDIQPELTKHLVDSYLSESKIKKACEIFSKNIEPISNEYLSKFNIYCLLYSGKKDEAQLYFDLKKELGFSDQYFEEKINYLFGYTSNIDNSISEENILDFHLAHRTDPNFVYQPKETTDKIIWKYLSSSKLLSTIEKIEVSEYEKISVLERATHNKNYSEKDLFEIYKRFQFNINQLLNTEQSYKTLSSIEARALVYQKVLLESETIERLKLLKILKNLFVKEKIGDAFDIELKRFLAQIEPTDVPDNLTSFYYTNIKIKKDNENKIKFNNDILHQSKLINYFNGDYSRSKIEKDIDNFLKKIKKDKKYFFSKKDQIFLESLKTDGIKIDSKYDDLYKADNSEIPTDIQVLINNNEMGAALLRIVEVIGQDDLERIDEDTIYFIIHTLNQLNIDQIRNTILLKVLPLKV
tara:strand:- start:327 stop:2099 length:1773 start_codon:yes stop_codon:yes gene_type:complete